MGRAIFISYRRDDTEGEAGRLFDDLVRAFGESAVFMDVDGITPGVDFRKAIDENVASCGVLLAMIGPRWATIANPAGVRRLDNENDYVRLEIASALHREIAVIPVLVHDAHMPHGDVLPENLKDLAYRNSVEITHARWNSDVQLLIAALQSYVAPPNPADTKPVHAKVAVQLPPANSQGKPPDDGRRLSPKLSALAVAAILLVLGIAGWLFLRPKSHAQGGDNPATVSASAQTASATPQNIPPAVPPSSLPGTNPVAPTTKQTSAALSVPPAHGAARPATGSGSAFVGTWVNPEPAGKNGLNRMQIARDGDRITVHAWGQCTPEDCDWKISDAKLLGTALQCSFNLGFKDGTALPTRVAEVTMRPAGDRLSVTIVNTYTMHGPVQHQLDFVRTQ